jgi:hypothetical protein
MSWEKCGFELESNQKEREKRKETKWCLFVRMIVIVF